MTIVEAIAKYSELSGVVGRAPIPDAYKDEIRKLYKYFTGDKLRRCNCPDVYSDAMIIIGLKLRNMTNIESKYKLKRGVVIQMPGSTDVYTRDNLTDDVAREYLDKYPNKSNLFETIPVEQTEEQAEEQTEETPEEQTEETPTEDEAQKKQKSKKRKK